MHIIKELVDISATVPTQDAGEISYKVDNAGASNKQIEKEQNNKLHKKVASNTKD